MTVTAEQSLTEQVRLVLDNDESLYRMRREIVQNGIDADLYPHQIAEALQAWAEELAGIEEIESNDARSLLQLALIITALGWVDWDSLARDWMAEEGQGPR